VVAVSFSRLNYGRTKYEENRQDSDDKFFHDDRPYLLILNFVGSLLI
jgi:hypothetical protein